MLNPSYAFPQPGAVFHGRYRVVRCIKAGAMGAVYEVVDETTNSSRAMKVMLPGIVEDPDLRARFAREAKVTGAIESDHIVRVSDAGIDATSGMPFLVMDLLRGEDLGGMLKRRGPLPPAEVVTYLFQVALALDKTHAARIVHRDLKPDNLFITSRDDGTPCVKILDFGIAKMVAQRTQAQATSAMGTPLYMSPEQILGDGTIGPSADLYALAHVAYTLLVAEEYWAERGTSAEALFPMLSKILRGADEAPSARAARRRGVTLPPAFDAWFQRAAAVEPGHRFERATHTIAALGEALGLPTPRSTLPSVGGTAPWVLAAVAQSSALHAASQRQSGSGQVVGVPQKKQKKSPVGLIIGGVMALLTIGGIAATVLGVLSPTPVPVALNDPAPTTTQVADNNPASTPTEFKPVETAPTEAKPAESAAAKPAETTTVAAATTPGGPRPGGPLPTGPGGTKTTEKEPPKEEKPAEPPKEEKPVTPPLAEGGGEFNRGAATSALGAAEGAARGCKTPDGPTGTGNVTVTFAPSGNVTLAQVQGAPFAGTPVGGCVARAYRSARVPPFSGAPVSVTKSFTIY